MLLHGCFVEHKKIFPFLYNRVITVTNDIMGLYCNILKGLIHITDQILRLLFGLVSTIFFLILV